MSSRGPSPTELRVEALPSDGRPGAGGKRVRRRPSSRRADVAGTVPSESDWRRWMRDFGLRVRRTRDFLGLPQEQLAKAAGVSQGAISRLETGHGMATPLVIVLKVQQALAGQLRQLDPSALDADLRRTIDLVALLAIPAPGGVPDVPDEPAIGRLVRLFRDTPERHREALLTIVDAAVAGLKASSG